MMLYYITDRRQFPGDEAEKRRRLLARIAECAAAGVDYIQLREKDLSARELERLACEAARLVSQSPRTQDPRTRLLINSRLDVALACGAHGVHLPARDVPASEARVVLSRAGKAGAMIAVSAHTVQEVSCAEAHGADLAVFGPVFEKDNQALNGGLERLRHACCRREPAAHPMPVLALGGIAMENAWLCREAGAAGIAGIRLFQDNDVEKIVNKLRESFL